MKLNLNVTIDIEDRTEEEALDELDEAIDENGANDSRAWMLFELGHCNIPNSTAVSFGNDMLMAVRSALEDLVEEKNDQGTV